MTPSAAVTVSPELVPYGKALAAVRHRYDIGIKKYFEGLSKNTLPPSAAFVAATFQQLCELRRTHTLPADAAWFDEQSTYFADGHETPFKNYVRKLYKRA
jgi:hypothetical protein